MNELKPCPFCGETPSSYTINSKGYGLITCYGCKTTFKFMLTNTLEDVKEAWNRRAGEEKSEWCAMNALASKGVNCIASDGAVKTEDGTKETTNVMKRR